MAISKLAQQLDGDRPLWTEEFRLRYRDVSSFLDDVRLMRRRLGWVLHPVLATPFLDVYEFMAWDGTDDGESKALVFQVDRSALIRLPMEEAIPEWQRSILKEALESMAGRRRLCESILAIQKGDAEPLGPRSAWERLMADT